MFLHECFSHGIYVQYGGFPHMKHAGNAAMPVACTVVCVEAKLFCVVGL